MSGFGVAAGYHAYSYPSQSGFQGNTAKGRGKSSYKGSKGNFYYSADGKGYNSGSAQAGKGKAKPSKGESTGVDTSYEAPIDKKPYNGALEDLYKNTQVRKFDFDDKALRLFDHLHENGGRVPEAAAHLEKALKEKSRDQIKNWKPYVYTLLKAFDAAAYKDMKVAANPPKSEAQVQPPPQQPTPAQLKSPEKTHTFNAGAAEFVPGAAWSPKASLDCGPDAAAKDASPKSPKGVVNLTPSPKKSPGSPAGEEKDVGFFGWAGCCAERSKDQR